MDIDGRFLYTHPSSDAPPFVRTVRGCYKDGIEESMLHADKPVSKESLDAEREIAVALPAIGGAIAINTGG